MNLESVSVISGACLSEVVVSDICARLWHHADAGAKPGLECLKCALVSSVLIDYNLIMIVLTNMKLIAAANKHTSVLYNGDMHMCTAVHQRRNLICQTERWKIDKLTMLCM